MQDAADIGEVLLDERPVQAELGHEHGVLLRVDAALSEFVDDYRHAVQVWLLQKAVQQRRLAAAEEAGEHRHWHPLAGPCIRREQG